MASAAQRVIRWRSQAAAAIGGFALLAAAGCVKDDPAFRSDDLTTVNGLAGSWESTSLEKPRLVLTFTEDRQTVRDGRLAARGTNVQNEGAKGDSAVVYPLVITTLEKDDAGTETVKTFQARAYAVDGDGRSLLCIQGDDPASQNTWGLFSISKQVIVCARIDGETLLITGSKVQIALAPSVQLLDPPASDDAPAPAVDAALKPDDKGEVKGATLLTNSPDRALWVYRTYGSRPGFWDDKALEFRRVRHK